MGSLIIIPGWLCFVFFSALVILFILTCFQERDWSAAGRGCLFFVPMLGIFAISLIVDVPAQPWIVMAILVLGGVFVLLLILPSEPGRSIRLISRQEQIDERDALFHRFYRLTPGTPEFEAYYREHPDKANFDEMVRALPSLGRPGSKTYHPLASPLQVATFSVLNKITREIGWEAAPIEAQPVQASPEESTQCIKGFAHYLGADLVGMTRLNPAYVYSHIGRSPGEWGAPIELDHDYAIAIAVEMTHEMIRHAPETATTTETAFKYFESAKIAMILARYINLLGYEARAHVDGNYRVMCIPVAADAGLGELGRLGLLITPEFGPRVRLSLVTTNLPLLPDKPITFGVQHFCSFCKRCATNCPSGSIDAGEKAIYAGVEKWQSEQDNCYRFWRKQGTDCAICIKVCPYSNPNSLMHNMIRWVIRRNNLARRFAFWCDEFIYGDRRSNRFPTPHWHSTS